MRFLSNFGCKIIFMCSVNFWHQQDRNSLFKGGIVQGAYHCQVNNNTTTLSFFTTIHWLI